MTFCGRAVPKRTRYQQQALGVHVEKRRGDQKERRELWGLQCLPFVSQFVQGLLTKGSVTRILSAMLFYIRTFEVSNSAVLAVLMI